MDNYSTTLAAQCSTSADIQASVTDFALTAIEGV